MDIHEGCQLSYINLNAKLKTNDRFSYKESIDRLTCNPLIQLKLIST